MAKRSFLVTTLLVLTVGRADAVDVTTCGQQVPARDVASLVADLDCNGGAVVVLGERATLLMNGHAVIGQVGCTGSCTITGPGDVSGASGFAAGIYVNYGGERGTVEISQVTVHHNFDGIGDFPRRLILTDVVVSNNTNYGIFVPWGSIRGTNVTANDNGRDGIYSGRGSVRLYGLTAIGNGQIGLNHSRGRTVLSESTLTGNQWTQGTGPLDLYSWSRPRVVNTVCEHSLGPVGPWGVCTGD